MERHELSFILNNHFLSKPLPPNSGLPLQCDLTMVTDYVTRMDPAFIFRRHSLKATLLKDAFDVFLSR
jgi:hypothetical protein